jgi:thiamine-phosphate pyrophosphorylase
VTASDGINLGNLGDVLAAGAKRVCVVSAILNAPDVTKACAEFRSRLEIALDTLLSGRDLGQNHRKTGF